MWGTSPGSELLPHPWGAQIPPPPTCCMITNEITSASWERAISLLHWVITLYKRPAQLSARPGPYTPGQARTARNRLLAAGSLVDTASRAGGRSWGGTAPGLPGPQGQSQEEWCIPSEPPTQLSLGRWRGHSVGPHGRGRTPTVLRPRGLRGEGPHSVEALEAPAVHGEALSPPGPRGL